ncbi:RNA-binding protein 44 isoform X2 [Gambusia affinis]|uniref:RNA-binding protein 44 isoform X1 n=1 Tax=Gambusia affinis TaxID=33528 RepID=UPI001CDC5A39|nr:RNA-binding protein 44 isoform X1 [Gambusia affinis]XP_043987020.1 RNA-binding protein 44 isoform X1 [Gambusia affinis]XP_043987021.1 RNA-binding protein 44 isoform X2 [Gambusia affinis]
MLNSKRDTAWTTSPADLHLLMNHPSAVRLAGWPGLPATVYYEEPALRSVYRVVDCPAVFVPSQLLAQSVTPPYCICEHSNAKENRKLLLHRSVLELVNTHHYLALTDTELLRWYLSLSAEDRGIILDEGGLHYFLQNHPGLELSQGHVYLKQASLQMSKMLPGDTRENLPKTGFSHSLTRFQNQVCEEACDNAMVPQMAYGLPLSHTLNQNRGLPVSQPNSSIISAAVPFNMYLERSRQRKPEDSAACSQRAASTIQAQSECPVENSGSSQQPRVDAMKLTQRSEGGTSHTAQIQQAPPSAGPAGENNVLGDQRTSVSHVEIRQSSEDEKGQFNFPIKDDGGSLVCLAGNGVTLQNAGALIQLGDPPADNWPKSTAEKFTSTAPCAPSCDAAVNTDVQCCTAKQTQTEGPNTSEYNVMTELQMSDLDYLAEELIKLQTIQERKEPRKNKSPGSVSAALRTDCGCKQRAQQAELALLTLHYELCRQHVWRLYYTSAEGHLSTAIAEDPPPNIVNILQKLETDYNQMKNQILTGVPLEQLSPLCVESEKITTGACYVPEQILTGLLGKTPSGSTQGTQKNVGAGDVGGPDGDKQSCQKPKLLHKEDEEDKRAAALVPKERLVKQMGLEEVNFSEAWYDAQEDLQLPGPAVDTADNDRSVGGESSSSVLYVSNLPGHMTQSDVRQLFENFQPSEVSIVPSKNGVRVAIVMVDGPEAAKAAVRELNGHQLHSRTIHIRHLSGAAAGGLTPGSTWGSTAPEDANTNCRLTEKKLVNPAVLNSSIQTRRVVSIFPTAKGTCVPQHFGTMGGLDALMSELTQLHPHVHRQTILDALMELKTTHHGVLASLSLSTIRDMTSALLNKSPTVTQN